MNKHGMEILEFNKIKEILRDYAISEQGKDMIDGLKPYDDINLIKKYLLETTEARNIVDISSSIPIHSLSGMKNIIVKLKRQEILQAVELEVILTFIEEGQRLKRFMKGKTDAAPNISTYALSISDLNDVKEEINRCIFRGRVLDKASSSLGKIRKRIMIVEERIKGKLDMYLKDGQYSGYLHEAIISQRDGRYVIPIKSQHKNSFEGNVLDVSRTGSTVFVEPAAIKKLQEELNTLRLEEENEIYKILATLSELVSRFEGDILINLETMIYYDFLLAKGKYSRAIGGRNVSLNTSNIISISGGRHPLLGASAVPLDFDIGDRFKNLIITGPNTGGKTVVIKTVGLLTLMVQAGLHPSVSGECSFAIFLDILADIGDGQSIEHNLSTFSSHIKNIINILEKADQHTLVILDEIGAGTDPGEGMGIGVSVLEELYKKQATIIATTHYNEIKDFAANHKGFVNGSMDFDINTLSPLYRLRIGLAGESNAFLIALRLGMEKELIERAHEITYKEKKVYQSYSPKEASSEIEKFNNQPQQEKRNLIEENVEGKNTKAPQKFKIGDCVYISTMNRTGIVCELENSKGELGVMVMRKKLKINHKRLSLYIEGGELYPEDYDFDIIFETKEDRKKKRLMDRKHVEGLVIEHNKK